MNYLIQKNYFRVLLLTSINCPLGIARFTAKSPLGVAGTESSAVFDWASVREESGVAVCGCGVPNCREGVLGVANTGSLKYLLVIELSSIASKYTSNIQAL
jgi:hypothetical protein